VFCKTAKICTLSRGISIKNIHHICHISNITLFPKYSCMFFTLQFSILNTSHLTTFVYVSIAPPLSHTLLLSHFIFRNRTPTLLQLVLYTKHQQWGSTVLTVGKSDTQKAQDCCMTSVTKPQHLQSPYYQAAVLYTLSLTHCNASPTTNSWTVTFPSPCTSDTHHSTYFMLLQDPQSTLLTPKISEVCVANVSQIRM